MVTDRGVKESFLILSNNITQFNFDSDFTPNPTNGDCNEGSVKTFDLLTHQRACGKLFFKTINIIPLKQPFLIPKL